jgi:hypothetical protein
MARIPPDLEELQSFVLTQKVVTLPELMEQFDRSRATIFRLLNQIKYITSYNRNHSGIALPSIPKFDPWGLWKFKKFYFSRWKNLSETIQNIVDKSPAGLYPKELQETLGVRVHNHLSMCTAKTNIVRNNDFGYPIYFSAAADTREKQYEERTTIFRKKVLHERPMLSNESVIKILLAIIKNHAITVEKMMRVLETEGLQFSNQSIEWLFDKYDIEKKGSPSS